LTETVNTLPDPGLTDSQVPPAAVAVDCDPPLVVTEIVCELGALNPI
jgi:hypothetical protein